MATYQSGDCSRFVLYRLGRERARRLLAASSLLSILPVLLRPLLRRTVGIEIRRTGYTFNALRIWHSFLFMPHEKVREAPARPNFVEPFATVR